MRTQLIRTATKRLDTLHASSYFSPIMAASYEQAGLPKSTHYFAARASALGAVSSELVAATFFSFNPASIAKVVPSCWELATPTQIHAARIRGVRSLMDSLKASFVNEDQASSIQDAALRLRENLAPIIDVQDIAGRALYAAHRSVLDEEYSRADPQEPLFDLWVTTTLIREFRGDGHIAALVSHGVQGLDASVLDCATGRAWRPSAARRSRGWSDEMWRTAATKLAGQGFLSDESDMATLTAAGQDLKESIESATDLAVAAAWSHIDDETLSTVREDAKLIAEAVSAAELIPTKLFGRDQS